jgi:hypothetical protein
VSVVVIGVDPGDSTGVGIIRDTELFYAYQGDPGEALTLTELTITRFNNDDDVVAVACERFVSMSRQARTHQPTAQRVAGALEHMARTHGCMFRYQGPADAHAIADNEKLKQLGMLQTPGTIGQLDASDANMAVRHALLYLSNTHARLFHDILAKHHVIGNQR